MTEAIDHVPVSIMTKCLAQEKQITIDPASFVSTRDDDFHVHLPPLPPARNKFLSLSLPSSATSSPRFASTFLKKNKKRSTEDDNGQNPCRVPSPYMVMRSDLTRSKSCGEGRTSAPSVDFDIVPLHHPVHAFPKPFIPTTLLDHRSTDPAPGGIRIEEEEEMGLDRLDSKEQEQEFKCGALCLFLPGFGKAKAINRKRDGQADNAAPTVMSRTVSLEKFECGSWASVGINKNDNSGELPSSGNLYFDLPLELIRGIKNDSNHPVTAAFVFDKDLKGVLRNGTRSSTWRRPSQQGSPPRHVRFSTSSSQPASPAASCVTPRLQKARAEFLEFLEEQST